MRVCLRHATSTVLPFSLKPRRRTAQCVPMCCQIKHFLAIQRIEALQATQRPVVNARPVPVTSLRVTVDKSALSRVIDIVVRLPGRFTSRQQFRNIALELFTSLVTRHTALDRRNLRWVLSCFFLYRVSIFDVSSFFRWQF